MVEVFLPRTDGGVAVQAVLTAVLFPSVVYLLFRSDRRDWAWLAAGLGMMWIAFTALRTLH